MDCAADREGDRVQRMKYIIALRTSVKIFRMKHIDIYSLGSAGRTLCGLKHLEAGLCYTPILFSAVHSSDLKFLPYFLVAIFEWHFMFGDM